MIPTMVTLGTTFPIAETSLLTLLQQRLKNVDLKKAEDTVKARVVQTIRKPTPIFTDAAESQEPRTWFIDPTVTLDRDVMDHTGAVLVKKGTRYNPLEHRTLSTQLVFILGTKPKQITWALMQPKTKIILVSGSPLTLEEQYHTAVYFDQGGHLCTKLNIKAFPTRVFQDTHQLRCETVVLPS